MSATFSFSRLLQLLRKQWIENARFYLLAALALIGILGIVLLFWFSLSNNSFKEESLYIIFTFGLYIAGAVFASISFNMLGEKEKGTYWLAFPASHFEKLLCILLYNVVFFTLVYCACFFLLKTVAFTYIQNLVATNPTKYHWRYMDWREHSNDFSVVFAYFIYGFFAVQAFYVLGSIYFERFSFIVTTVVAAVLIGGFVWYAIYLSKNMLPNSYSWNGNHVTRHIADNGGFSSSRYDLPGLLSKVFSLLIQFIWAPVFWMATWYRLREKQI